MKCLRRAQHGVTLRDRVDSCEFHNTLNADTQKSNQVVDQGPGGVIISDLVWSCLVKPAELCEVAEKREVFRDNASIARGKTGVKI